MNQIKWVGVFNLMVGFKILFLSVYYIFWRLPFIKQAYSPDLGSYITRGYLAQIILLISSLVSLGYGFAAFRKGQKPEGFFKNSLIVLGSTILLDLILYISIYKNIIAVFHLGWIF